MPEMAICFTLRLQPLIGHTISEHIGEAIDIADRLQIPVEFEANGRKVVVWPGDWLDPILASWNAGHSFVCQNRAITGV